MKKEKIEKEGQNKSRHLGFVSSKIIWLSSSCIKNLKTLAQIEAEKSTTENFVREKEKWTNKGTDQQYVADSMLHSTTCHYQALYQISRS